MVPAVWEETPGLLDGCAAWNLHVPKEIVFSKALRKGDASLGAARAGNPAQAFLRLKAKEGPKSGSPLYIHIYIYPQP